MKQLNRRKFIKKSIQTSSLIGVGISTGNIMAKSKNMVTAVIPRPIQVVIDDVGWWSGKDGSEYQEPFRTGIDRNHVPADYQAIVELGKALNIRPQAAFILGEWDRKNILKHVPHCTWMGENWDNSKWVGPWLEEAADIINQNKDHFEITMHGLGHEWWTDGVFTRAEWADKNGVMRPEADIAKHIEAFAKIMKRNDLGELPTSFVPTAFNHGFGVTPGNDISFAELLRSFGFTYINTPFYGMLNREKVQHKLFGIDSGLITVDRGSDLLDWDIIGEIPTGEIRGTTCGMHWPNLLHSDPERNDEIVDEWVKLLSPYNEKLDTILSKNSSDFLQQIIHHQLTRISVKDQSIEIDFSESNKIDSMVQSNNFMLKASSDKELTFASDNIQIKSTSSKKVGDTYLHVLEVNRNIGDLASIKFI